jgi:hypothetical protein
VANASGRSLGEKVGASVFVLGVSLAGFAVGIWQEPKTVWAAGRLAGVAVAAGGLAMWGVARAVRARQPAAIVHNGGGRAHDRRPRR